MTKYQPEEYKYIFYDGRIYSANWLGNKNRGHKTADSQMCNIYHPADKIETNGGYSIMQAVQAKYSDLIFLKESDKLIHPEYFI